MKEGTKFHELVRKITFGDRSKESILQTILNWTKTNDGVNLIQKKKKL